MNMTFRLVVLFICLAFSTSASALKGRISTEDEMTLLKKDILDEKIKIGKTRLNQIRNAYGEPSKITETSDRLTYDYGDLKIEFDKNKYFRDWEYDYTYGTAYSDEIDDLRFDLEDGQIVGDYYAYTQLRKDYEEPTKAFETDDDGAMSIYYYGEIKLTFENVITVRSWSGKNLDAGQNDGVLGTEVLPPAATTPAPAPAASAAPAAPAAK